MDQFVHADLISIYPLNFNKLGRIKSVHQVFIFKNIAHLIADYTSTANLSVNVGVRMPVNPGIDPAVGNQFSVFTRKAAVQHGTSMIRSHHLKCRQMMCNHDNMGCSAFLDAFSDKTDTRLVHPVEVIHLKQLPIELYLAEVIHAFPHEIPVVLVNMTQEKALSLEEQTDEDMARKSKDDQIRELQAQLTQARKEAELEKLRAKAYDTMINVAEETFNIPIRKKSGTKR